MNLAETQFLHLKTHGSASSVDIDQEVLAELQGMRPVEFSGFIICSGTRPPRPESVRPYYRCKHVFDRLNRWLRAKGITSNKPLHELRKEVGAIVATKHGIYAASRFLRHSDITTTARHYSDHKDRISSGLGRVLAGEESKVGVA